MDCDSSLYPEFAGLSDVAAYNALVVGARQNIEALPQLMSMLKAVDSSAWSVLHNNAFKFAEYLNSLTSNPTTAIGANVCAGAGVGVGADVDDKKNGSDDTRNSTPGVEYDYCGDNVNSLSPLDEFDMDLLWDAFDDTLPENDLLLIAPELGTMSLPSQLISRQYEGGVNADKEAKGASANDKPDSSSSKKRKLSAVEAYDKIFEFPKVIIQALNSGDEDSLNRAIDEYVAADAQFTTPVLGERYVVGRENIKTFFVGLLASTPDLMATITDLRLSRNRSIIFRGVMEGTFVQNVATEDYLNMADPKENLVKLLKDGRKGDSGFGVMSAEEEQRLAKLTEDARNRKLSLATVSNYICRVTRMSVRHSASRGCGYDNIIRHIAWDWKTTQIEGVDL